MGLSYFFDSYAIIESIKGNPNYAALLNETINLTMLNLMEVYWFALNEYGENKADELYSRFKNNILEIDDNTLKEAMKFRKEHKKKNLSYTDCIGYIYAKRNGMKFLTGDKEFESMGNVEFVK